MANSRPLELEAAEAEVAARRQTQRGPSLARRGLVLFAVLAAVAVVWEVVKVAFAVTDYNLPHIYAIPLAFLKPLASTGQPMGLYILDQTQYTVYEALAGFAMGALAGFALGVVFAHSVLLERGCLPYVVASQTVPILAVAPMVVIWLGRGFFSIALIASYLTFFPVVINTLRGLLSVEPAALELMQSYAATRREILFQAARAGLAALSVHRLEDLGHRQHHWRADRRNDRFAARAGLEPGLLCAVLQLGPAEFMGGNFAVWCAGVAGLWRDFAGRAAHAALANED